MMPADMAPQPAANAFGLAGCDKQRQFSMPPSHQMAPTMNTNLGAQFTTQGTTASSASMMGRSPPGPVASARNPFAAMPRELRNHQLRNNLQAVAEAFSAATVSVPAGGAPAPGAAIAAVQPPPPPPPPAAPGRNGVLRTSWPGSAPPQPPAGPNYCHQPVSNGMAARQQQSLSLPLPTVSCQPGMGVVAVAPGMQNSTYIHTQQQQQQHQLLVNAHQQQQQQYVGLQNAPVAVLISDPLPYLSMQQAQLQLPHQQQHMGLVPQAVMSQAVPVSGPCSLMMPSEPQGLMYAACSSPGSTAGQQQPALLSSMQGAVPALGMSAPIAVVNGDCQQLQLQQMMPGQMEQLLMRQQALQALEQAVQQQLLQLLPDA